MQTDRLMVWLLPLLGYMLGSIPWGLVVTRGRGEKNLLHRGSGNIGATNVGRIAGTQAALFTLSADMLKGAIPTWLALRVSCTAGIDPEWYAGMVALCAIMGHLFPCYLGLRNGGKGVATAAGCYLVLSPLALLSSALLFVLVVRFANRVSAGSLSAAALLPGFVWIDTRSVPLTLAAVITAVLIFLRHTANIRRLRRGQEPVFRSKKR